ncbi:hypothetical protein AB0H57_27585 [Micromonospora sp. NPDC050686]|uniref:hypothetical protein n=1 Tax=Micromonospora sp. NPDC050686 TaxID=3154631 RepID=UPI0033C6C0A5
MQDAWRAYLELAMGLTEAPRKRAQDVVRRMVGSGGATAAQLQALGEELVSTGLANREALTKLVRFEVDRALGAVGLATADEVAELTRRVHELERQLRDAKGGPEASVTGPPSAVPTSPPAPGKAVAKPPAPGKAVAKPPAPGKAVAKKVAKKAVAKKSPGVVTRAAGPAAGAAEPAAPVTKARAARRLPGDAR